jgi:Excinuclease ATPase subunit
VEKISGLSPTIAVNQKTISSNPRSTVGTLTEIYDYLRLLYSHIGIAHCPKCGKPVTTQTPNHMAERVFAMAMEFETTLIAPVIAAKKGGHQGVLEEIYRSGWPQIIIDGITYSSEEGKDKLLDKNKAHNIGVPIDKFDLKKFGSAALKTLVKQGKNISKTEQEALATKKKKLEGVIKEEKERILASVKKALEMGKGRIDVSRKIGKIEKKESFSSFFSCSDCQVSLPDIEPKIFSFNSPYGACKTCQGLGKLAKVNRELVLNPRLSLNEGAILPWFSLGRWTLRTLGVPYQKWSLEKLAEKEGFSLNVPFKELPEDIQQLVLFGDKKHSGYEAIIPRMERAYRETTSEYLRAEISKYMSEIACPDCDGARLSPEALAVKVGGKKHL